MSQQDGYDISISHQHFSGRSDGNCEYQGCNVRLAGFTLSKQPMTTPTPEERKKRIEEARADIRDTHSRKFQFVRASRTLLEIVDELEATLSRREQEHQKVADALRSASHILNSLNLKSCSGYQDVRQQCNEALASYSLRP